MTPLDRTDKIGHANFSHQLAFAESKLRLLKERAVYFFPPNKHDETTVLIDSLKHALNAIAAVNSLNNKIITRFTG